MAIGTACHGSYTSNQREILWTVQTTELKHGWVMLRRLFLGENVFVCLSEIDGFLSIQWAQRFEVTEF